MMPLSEFYRMNRGRNESSQQKSTSTADLSHIPDNNEFVELVWENGQIMMQSPSNRARRDNNSNNFQPQVSRFGDQDLGNTSNTKTGNGLMVTIVDDFTATIPSSDLGIERDDDMAPWLNYDDPLHNNYNSEFFPGLSSITMNDHHHDRKNPSNPSFERNQPIASSGALSNASSGIINFSHFSRPLALARANTNSVSTVANASSSCVEKTGSVSKVNFVPISNEMGSTIRPNLLLKMVSTRNIEKSETVPREGSARNEVPCQQVDGVGASKGVGEAEKAVEPVVASSSMCSGNNPEQCSDDQNHNLKRKSREADDSEGRSEDVEEESVGIKKTAPSRGGTGAKRSRAAEVHNLSERRRRDRINEKMRALQELIPNCNKVDKASMLDEAIEYLKTLQLQVQIMSMGTGMYMPHMMLPPGVPGHIAHFPPMMGVGMGMGMGFGMGMDRFQGLRAMPFSGPANYQMMPGPSLPVFGPTGPGVPMSVPHQPSVPLSTVPTNPGGNDQAPHDLVKEVNGVPPS